MRRLKRMTTKYKMLRVLKEIKNSEGETVGFYFRGFRNTGTISRPEYVYCDLYIPAKNCKIVANQTDGGFNATINFKEITEVVEK